MSHLHLYPALYRGWIHCKRCFCTLSLLITLVLLAGCETHTVIVNDVGEREANEIVVFLASKGIPAAKTPSASSAPGGADTSIKWSIAVPEDQSTEAMSILNQNGLPRQKGTNLLELFAKSGLMTSEREDAIRYQAGLAEQIAGVIRKIDGVLDADVQLSFPQDTGAVGGPAGASAAVSQKVTAAVYVKHQGILDDPNSHLVTKIKRLVAGSVNNLDVNDVTVISDRSRFTDVMVSPEVEALEPRPKEYVSIWSIVMSSHSAGRFRFIFFLLTALSILFAGAVGWMTWKFYPILKKRGGLKALLQPAPLADSEVPVEPPPKEEPKK